MGVFRFKRFSVQQDRSALKVGTDAVLLGAAMTLSKNDLRLLDIGTGTGVISLMAAQRLSDMCLDQDRSGFHIDAIDIDGPSIEDAIANFASSPWCGKLSARHVSLGAFGMEGPSASDCPGSGRLYDLIFTNPPFFEGSLKNPDWRKSAARHSVTLSVSEICSYAASHLKPDGRLSLVYPSDGATDLIRCASSFGLYPFRMLNVKTVPSKAPMRVIAEFSRTRGSCIEEILTLNDGPIRRSAEYDALTSPFYL